MTRLRDLGELGLLERLRPFLAQRDQELLAAAGDDDAAIWRERDGSITVATCDTFIAGVHFDLDWMPPVIAGWRACALTLGDLSAKGARPTYGLVALAAPATADLAVVEQIYAGLAEAAGDFGLRLAGGDTSATAGPLSVTLFALGRAEREPLPRAAVRPGWKIGVTGPLGGEAAALAERRPTRPRPRFGAAPPQAACGDISDGLVRELVKFRAAAGIGAEIDPELVPVAEGATLQQALTGGEEVELVCCAPGELGDGVVVIGNLNGDGRIRVGGEEVEGGYDHFA